MWLPGDETHPPRPAVPILYHLTFTEIHAMELGAYLGALIVWAIHIDQQYMAFILAIMVARKIISRRRARGDKTGCTHDVGLHDARAEPHYFGALAAGVPLAYIIITTFI